MTAEELKAAADAKANQPDRIESLKSTITPVGTASTGEDLPEPASTEPEGVDHYGDKPGEGIPVTVSIEPAYESPLFHREPVQEVNRLFRHKTIRRFRFGRFEFKNNEIRLTKQSDVDEFLAGLEELPRIETVDIFEINEQAAAAAERQAVGGSNAIRGAMNSEDILTAKDRQRLAERESPKSAAAAGGLAGFFNKPK